MFREMRRKDKQLLMEENIEILNNGEYGMLSTIGDNEYPCVTPLSFVYYNDNIYFHGALEGQKFDNIKNNNKVSFCTTIDIELVPSNFSTKYKSVVVFGKASEVFDVEKEEALLAIIEKYSKEFMEQGKKYIQNAKNKTKVIKIEIEHMTGKAER